MHCIGTPLGGPEAGLQLSGLVAGHADGRSFPNRACAWGPPSALVQTQPLPVAFPEGVGSGLSISTCSSFLLLDLGWDAGFPELQFSHLHSEDGGGTHPRRP